MPKVKNRCTKITMWSSHRYISGDDVRCVCIKNNYYTCGDCEDYANMLSIAYNAKEATDEIIEQLAIDIFNHSNVDELERLYGCDDLDLLSSIMYNLLDVCTNTVQVNCAGFIPNED